MKALKPCFANKMAHRYCLLHATTGNLQHAFAALSAPLLSRSDCCEANLDTPEPQKRPSPKIEGSAKASIVLKQRRDHKGNSCAQQKEEKRRAG